MSNTNRGVWSKFFGRYALTPNETEDLLTRAQEARGLLEEMGHRTGLVVEWLDGVIAKLAEKRVEGQMADLRASIPVFAG